MLESLKLLDNIRLNFSPGSLFILNLALSVIMFGIALEIKPKHFKTLIDHPKSVLTGVVSQFVLLPTATFLLCLLLKDYITPSVALGFILVASCPGGNISNFMTHYAGGNVILSIGLTAIATVGAVFLTPMNFAFWGGLYTEFINTTQASSLVQPLQIDTYEIFKTVFIILGIPLILGIVFSYKFPMITQKITNPIKQLSVLIFLVIVGVALYQNGEYFMAHIQYLFLLVLLHNAIALSIGYGMGSAMKLPPLDRRTITIETGIQNSGLGLVLIFNPLIFPEYLPTGGMAAITAWWGVWHIISGLGMARLWSAYDNRKKLQAA